MGLLGGEGERGLASKPSKEGTLGETRGTHTTDCTRLVTTEAVGPSIAYRGAKSGTAFNFT